MEAKRKRNTAFTSILSWKQCLNEGLSILERDLVTKYLKEEKRPHTSREISEGLNIERTNITKTLNVLVNELKTVEVKYYAKCRKTGRKVGYYGIVEQKPVIND